MMKRYILNAFDSRKVDRIAAITRSPISIQRTGAKEFTATRSVIMGPWKIAKSRTIPRATAPMMD